MKTRPDIVGATVLVKDGSLAFGPEEADKMWTDFDTGIIKGNSIFQAKANFELKDENGGEVNITKTVFVNMINVSAVIFHEDE